MAFVQHRRCIAKEALIGRVSGFEHGSKTQKWNVWVPIVHKQQREGIDAHEHKQYSTRDMDKA
jgi:hypothetical protein